MKRTGFKKRMLAILTAFVVMTTTCLPAMEVSAEAVLPPATNTSFGSASPLQFNTSMAGQLTGSDTKRFYKFTLGGASELNIGVHMEYQIVDVDISIYDADRTEVYHYYKSHSNWTNDFATDSIYLTGGTYYMQISSGDETAYSFTATKDSLSDSFKETQNSNNDMLSSAYSISLKKKYKGVLAENDDIDYYKFTVPAKGKINFSMNNVTNGTLNYLIYDKNVQLCYSGNIYEKSKASELIPLAAGKYYLVIKKAGSDYGVGSYSYSIDYSVTIPDAPSIKSVKNTAKKKMTVKWGKKSGASGYELQYSTKSNFKSGVVKKTISSKKTSAAYTKLTKGKKYYVRMRSYVTVNGARKYSKWSAKKSVIIKK